MEKEFAVDATSEVINLFVNEDGNPDYIEYINYIIDCCRNNRNVYLVANGVKIYSADYYSFDDYYLIVFGITKEEKDALERLVYFNNDIEANEKNSLEKLLTPAVDYLKEIHSERRKKLMSDNIQLSMKKTTLE